MREKIVSHRDLEVFKKAFDCAMELFECSRAFPKEETYSLTDQTLATIVGMINHPETWTISPR